ncbi:glycerol kinase [Atopobacter sp. AH10]|uniref:glycerol kinase GlpK n=1 Tax=Atopobacter sp. AH10 TaxID=2315861 RepID=UPI000EF218FA|nr:glycerol kinase GlpK [Atopobacter sp. AH10]RLK63853.1 glycerol kinase [Atopobacter sp. AH10]
MTTSTYIMAIDQGTTSSRAIIFDKQAQIITIAQKEFPQHFPHSGWVEHDPNDIWQSVQSVIATAFIQSGIKPEQIEAIGITNQRETTVVWDKQTGLPIYPAIVWQSRQSAPIIDELVAKGYEKFFHEKTGLILDPYFSASKIRFILDHVDGAQERAEAGELLFGTIDTWLVWKLTDGKSHVTDYTNASRTILFNINDLKWDEEILELLNIPKIMLPEVRSNSEVYGYTAPYHFYGGSVPIAGMAGDQQAALIGHLALEKGMVKNTYGTGSFIVMNTGASPKYSENRLLTTIAYKLGDRIAYALEGSIFVAGSAVQWLRDSVHMVETAKETERLAQESKTNDDIYMVPAFTGLGAPYWNSKARGAIFGMTRATNNADLAKATLQAIAYQVKDVMELMQKETGMPIPVLKVDGGASVNKYLMQFQADILDCPIERPDDVETTALGAAYLAGLAIGFFKDWASLENLKEGVTAYTPAMTKEKRERLYKGWKRAVKATESFSQEEEI